jgi:hypothetical protein
MTIPKLPTDGPEWTLYDLDLSTVLNILQPLDAALYLKLNDCGSGSMTLRIDDQAVVDGNIYPDYKVFAGLNYRGDFRGGFFVENIEYIDVNSAEYSGRAVKISGRGMLAIIDEAIVWDWMTPDLENTRKFGTLNTLEAGGDYPAGGVPVPKGLIMNYLLTEARDHRENPAGNHLHRFCWHISGVEANPMLLTWDFGDVNDSTPVAWTDAEDMEFRVGISLLDVLRQIAALEYDFTITRDPATGAFVLHAFAARIGTDLSNTVIFRPGMNCLEISNKSNGAETKNAVLVEFSDPVIPYTEVNDGGEIAATRRVESMLQASNASLLATATNYGQAELDAIKYWKTDIAIKVSDAVAPRIFLDYNIGDTVKYDDALAVIGSIRVTGAQLAWVGDNKFADVVLEIE